MDEQSHFRLQIANTPEVQLARYILSRWHHILGAAVAGALVGLLLALILPKQYRSEATVIFPTSQGGGLSILNSLKSAAGGAGGGDSIEARPVLGVPPGRLPSLEYAGSILRSRTTLEAVAKNLKLQEAWGLETFPETLLRLRKRLEFIPSSKDSVLYLTALDHDPELARKILDELIKQYDIYTERAVLTSAKRQRIFLEKQIELGHERLKALEDKVALYQREHGLEIAVNQPEVQSQLLGGLLGEEIQAMSQFEAAQGLVDEFRRLESSLLAKVEADTDFSSVSDPVALTLQAELSTAKLDLETQLLSRTEKHPEVQATRDRVLAAEQRLGSKLSSLRRASQEGLSSSAMIEAEAALESARKRLESAQAMISRRTEDLLDTPGVAITHESLAAELLLQRRLFGQLKLEYQAACLAEERDSIELEILDPPNVPARPYSPSKRLWTLGGLVLGGLLGLFFVLVAFARPILEVVPE